ncbi:MarR family transcriptional regulator [Neorhizobium sp. JUb45]|uniref:MarR family winged helix-turn-helix transcriptional regulator n=1 Tax=unclassified Neorhizobium TaxID=2629175 RepID=UPI001053410B|nr:MarR family transcriptional regulator [Neorhizobium sp. JUb45]TCR01231.1 MarR family transcriptional regulator for hemolysin [Neorhizobium sp. JUb45]
MRINSNDPKAVFGGAVVVFARRWRNFIDHRLAESGLTDASWTPLIYLYRQGDGLLQKELATASGLDDSSLVRLLDILSKRNLVERRIDPNDRRARRLYLTEEGRKAATAIRARLVALEHELLEEFGNGDIAAMLNLFERVETKIEQAREKAGKP